MSNYTIEEIYYWVAKNMICIPNKTNLNKLSEEEINNFVSKHLDTIKDVVAYMPRGMTTVGAAVAKCAILYDKEKAIDFLRNSKDKIFQGKEDPVYHFHLWLLGLKGPKRKKHDISTYEITLYACKNYCLGKKIKRLDRAKDNAAWNDQFEISKPGRPPKLCSQKKDDFDAEIVEKFIKILKEQDVSMNSANEFIAAFQKRSRRPI